MRLAVIAWLIYPAVCFGQINAEQTYQPYEPIILEVEEPLEEGQEVNAVWRVDAPAKMVKAGPSSVHIWAPPKAEAYQVLALVYVTREVEIDGVKGSLLIGPPRDYSTSFVVQGNGPRPPPEPGPGPDPEPEPDPEPDPDDRFGPSPFSGDGLRAVIIYEYDEIPSYPKAIQNQLYSESLKSWARNNMAEGDRGVDFRIFDKDAQAIEGSRWAEVLERERDGLPWLIAGNGRRGYEGPLPATEEETLRLLQELVE